MDKTVKILVIVFALMGLGLLGYYWINQWHTRGVEQATQMEKAASLKKIAQLEAEIQKLIDGDEVPGQGMDGKTDLANVFGSDKPMTAVQAETTDCQKITAQTIAFFHYLDSKAYLSVAGINMQAEELFEDIYTKLAANPPTNVGEMDNITNLIRNVAHLYRALGKERIHLIKEILHSEAAVVEPAIAVMYTWMTVCDTGNKVVAESTKLSTLYQYASFFLNTLGGRGYLLRRDSKLRMLVSYYALLTLDKANDAKLNAYGVDIRPHLDYLFYDINNQKGLLYRQRYLTHLAALRNKYQ